MIPEVPPPDPASDFGIESRPWRGGMSLAEIVAAETPLDIDIERTARMNKHTDNFAGHGMRDAQDYRDMAAIAAEPVSADDAFADAVSGALAEDLAKKLPTATLIALRREKYRQSIAQGKAALAAQQAIAAAALEHIRQLKVAVRCDEDALDGLLISEA